GAGVLAGGPGAGGGRLLRGERAHFGAGRRGGGTLRRPHRRPRRDPPRRRLPARHRGRRPGLPGPGLASRRRGGRQRVGPARRQCHARRGAGAPARLVVRHQAGRDPHRHPPRRGLGTGGGPDHRVAPAPALSRAIGGRWASAAAAAAALATLPLTPAAPAQTPGVRAGPARTAPQRATGALVVVGVAVALAAASAGSLGTFLVDSAASRGVAPGRSEEHTSELQSRENLVCRLLLEKKKTRGTEEGRTMVNGAS